jgi:cell division protein FtsZ
MAGMGYAVMGTAMRSGENRAVEAAMAAMASPLLESGAIDGARGILINITGSSNLKLSEVNEASTIIQNAAHEDANIIFGAVQDEAMGEEVKITVIATGFRQQEMPARRERMLAEATLPTVRYEVPIEPRVPISRPAAPPKFLSDEMVRPAPIPVERREPSPEPAVTAPGELSPELLPVPASVFDDDFFRSSQMRPTVSYEAEEPSRVEAGVHSGVYFTASESIQSSSPVPDTGVRAPFGGAAAQTDSAESDELDIPAFLRRGN